MLFRSRRRPLAANYGDRSCDYSGFRLTPEPWTPTLARLREIAVELAGGPLNAAVLQPYRDGDDRVGWRADDSPAVGPNPTVVSLSFGAERAFQIRHEGQAGPRINVTFRCVLASDSVRETVSERSV